MVRMSLASSSSISHHLPCLNAPISSASSAWGSHAPPSHQPMWMWSRWSKNQPPKVNCVSRTQTHGPMSISLMPVSSHASRRAASALLSPWWMPPPGSSHHDGLVRSAGSDACSSRTRDCGSRRIRRAAWRLGTRAPFSTRLSLRSADGEDGDVVGERDRREVARRLQQGLAEGLGVLAVVTPQDPGHALLAEELLAGAGLGQAIGVEEDEAAPPERQLPAEERA